MYIEEHLKMLEEAVLVLSNALADAESEIEILKERANDADELSDVIVATMENLKS